MNTMSDEQVNDRVKNLPVIVEIKEEVQETRANFNVRFDKGTKRMDSIEAEMKKGFDDVLKKIQVGNEDRNKKHSQVMDKLDEDKENRLLKKLEERDVENANLKKKDEERRKKRDDRIWEVTKGLLYIVAVLVAASYGLKLPF